MNKDYDWILGILASCNTAFQIACCHALLFNFRQKYGLTEGATKCCEDLLTAIIERETSIGIDA